MSGLPLIAIRHGPTQWNAERRLQGRSDVPLSEEGRERVRRWRLPPLPADAVFVGSPLVRARETAALLGLGPLRLSPLLAEMSFGRWEGARLKDLYQAASDEDAAAMRANEARGLDFQAPGGESPRQVQARLTLFLLQVAAAGRPTVIVTHKGVLRALLSLATGWDMTAPYPGGELDHDGWHQVAVAPGPVVRWVALNQPLLAAPV